MYLIFLLADEDILQQINEVFAERSIWDKLTSGKQWNLAHMPVKQVCKNKFINFQ